MRSCARAHRDPSREHTMAAPAHLHAKRRLTSCGGRTQLRAGLGRPTLVPLLRLRVDGSAPKLDLTGMSKPHPIQSVPAEFPRARPSREDAEEAVRTLIRWAGDDPGREGLA